MTAFSLLSFHELQYSSKIDVNVHFTYFHTLSALREFINVHFLENREHMQVNIHKPLKGESLLFNI